MRKTLSFIGLLIISAALFAFLLRIKRSEIFDYDVNQNYNYFFDNSEPINLELVANKVQLPTVIKKGDTAFIKIKIESTFLGNFFSPQIEIKSKDKKVIDFFEYGGSGYRYLNISSLLKDEPHEIELKERFLDIMDTNLELVFYTGTIKAESKILVISPHPDDAEIAAFGLYSKFPDSFVLTVTAGENGSMHYNELFTDSIKQYHKKGQIRTVNSISVPLFAGLSQHNILNLGFFDGTIKIMHDTNPLNVTSPTLDTDSIGKFRDFNISFLRDSLVGTSNWNSLIQNLELVLKSYQPDIIILPHPHMDRHTDHQFTAIGAIQAIKNLGLQNGDLYFYSNHYLTNEFFPYGKPGGTISLPPNFNDDFYFHSVYSHPLSEEDQMVKVLALDAMNDLRLNTDWRFWDNLLKLSFENFKVTLKGHENSYFKRAIRSNELFFVVPISVLYNKNNLEQLLNGKNFAYN